MSESSPQPPASPGVTWPDAARAAAFERWLGPLVAVHRLVPHSLRPASSDASFRRYLRLDAALPAGSLIVMDAPPPLEDVRPFVAIARRLEAAGLHAPRVLAEDADQGFLLLSDLGSTLCLNALHEARTRGDEAAAEAVMRDAVNTLIAWQRRIDPAGLPPFDDALLRRELALFPEWCLGREFGRSWTADEATRWQRACDLLVASALEQPVLAVHRDYMPRNLMLTPEGLGILDFQDAVAGPASYDLASLIRDAFVSWEEPQELDIAVRYWQQARAAGLPVHEDFGEFWRQVEWMGLQRHLKVLGIFCRLKHRDGKPRYSEDLPRFFGYAHRVATRYDGLRPLARLLEPLMGVARIEVFH
jgi:aminoglycoside/choline kinase family phosphotransferase